jgi:hypothetical protein
MTVRFRTFGDLPFGFDAGLAMRDLKFPTINPSGTVEILFFCDGMMSSRPLQSIKPVQSDRVRSKGSHFGPHSSKGGLDKCW